MTLRNSVYKQNNFLVNVKMKIFNTGVTLTATLSGLKQWLQLRFDFNSTVVRLSFDSHSTAIRPATTTQRYNLPVSSCCTAA